MLKELEIDIEFHIGRKTEIIVSKDIIEVGFITEEKGLYSKKNKTEYIQFKRNGKISFLNVCNTSFEEIMKIKVIISKIEKQLFNAYF